MALMTFALVTLLATTTPVNGGEADDPGALAGQRYIDSLVADVRERGSSRERALFARVSWRERAGALQRAARAAPTDALVQMLWSTQGGDARAWSRVEPGNGFAWMAALDAEAASLDEAGIDAAIARIAGAGGYDDHFVEAWLDYRRVIAARPMPASLTGTISHGDPGLAAGIMAMAYAAALPMSLRTLSRACKREKHPRVAAERFENCARIGRGLLRSESSVFSKRFGSGLVRNSGLEDAADREARRSLDWQLEASTELLRDASMSAEGPSYFNDLAATGSETRAQELLLARHGLPLQAPANWQGGR
jgi:hypothetical protein